MSTGHRALDPVVVGMQVGMQVVLAGLVALVVVMAVAEPTPRTPAVLVLAGVLVVAYGVVLLAHALPGPRARRVVRGAGLAAIAVLGLVLVWCTPTAAYLLLPLSFLFLEHLPARPAVAAVVGTTVVAVLLLVASGGWSVGAVVGPIASAAVAVVLGLSLQAFRRQAAEQERMYRDLLAVQDRLAASERLTGVLSERSRLAREIHDTVSQSLSSITLLLHAAERSDPGSPAAPHVRLARETAASALDDTRRFIRELAPPQLDEQSLGGALRRLAGTTWVVDGLAVDVRVADSIELPMTLQTALLRVAQGAMANVLTHARAAHAVVEVVQEPGAVRLTVTDDGVGIDATRGADAGAGRDSFGLRATRERVGQLGGTVSVTSAPGAGTTLAVTLPVAAP